MRFPSSRRSDRATRHYKRVEVVEGPACGLEVREPERRRAAGARPVAVALGLRLGELVIDPERRRQAVRPPRVGAQALVLRAGGRAFDHLDALVMPHDVADRLELGNRMHDRLDLVEHQRRLLAVDRGRVDFAPRLAFRPDQVRQHQARNQAGFPRAARRGLDRQPHPLPALRPVDGAYERHLVGQQLHPPALEPALGDRQELEEPDQPGDAGQSRPLPRQVARVRRQMRPGLVPPSSPYATKPHVTQPPLENRFSSCRAGPWSRPAGYYPPPRPRRPGERRSGALAAISASDGAHGVHDAYAHIWRGRLVPPAAKPSISRRLNRSRRRPAGTTNPKRSNASANDPGSAPA